jgi:hypothetical protein
MIVTGHLPTFSQNELFAGKDSCCSKTDRHTVRFASSDEVFFVETRSELQRYELWCTSEDFEEYRDEAKQGVKSLREKSADTVRDMEAAYQVARDLAKEQRTPSNSFLENLQKGVKLLHRWTTSSVPARGLERFCHSQDAKESRSQERLAARNLVLNLQQLLTKKNETHTEMIAQNYHSFSQHACLLAQMLAQAGAYAAAQTTSVGTPQGAVAVVKISQPASMPIKKEKRSSKKPASSKTRRDVTSPTNVKQTTMPIARRK